LLLVAVGSKHSDCKVQWTTKQNTAFGSGRVRHSATTVAACQQACLSTAHCTGFDFNPANKPTGQCWLSGPWSGRHPAPMKGVIHYTVIRICHRTYTRVILVWNSGIVTQVS